MATTISKFDGRFVKNYKAYTFFNGVCTTTACGRYIKASIKELKAMVNAGKIRDLHISVVAL